MREGETVIEQGGKGDYFYVCESGMYDVFVDDELVHTYVASKAEAKHPCFGELALMYSKPRAATVRAKCDGILWKLGRSGFRVVTTAGSRGLGKDALAVLRKVEFFS